MLEFKIHNGRRSVGRIHRLGVFPRGRLFERIDVFSFWTLKCRSLCFPAKKNAVKCKLYLKNSVKFVKKINLRPPMWRFFSSTAFPKTIVFLLLATYAENFFCRTPLDDYCTYLLIKKKLVILTKLEQFQASSTY